jgi:hypothetical protein
MAFVGLGSPLPIDLTASLLNTSTLVYEYFRSILPLLMRLLLPAFPFLRHMSTAN